MFLLHYENCSIQTVSDKNDKSFRSITLHKPPRMAPTYTELFVKAAEL